MKYPFLDLRRLHAPLMEAEKEACARVIESGRYLHGPETAALESEMSRMHASRECVAVSNGLDALRLILRGYIATGRLSPGDEIIVSANTYIASVLAITDAGLTPVLVEPEEQTMNLSAETAERAVSGRTRAIMEVHLYGTPARHSAIREVAARHGLLIIEDNAQSIGASEHGTPTGAMGDAAAFSFYPTKNIGAVGDAGAVVTADRELAAAIRALANYGSDRRYHNIYQGFNCRMDEIQAALLRVRLGHLEEDRARRQAAAAAYAQTLDNPLVVPPATIDTMTQVWHQYVVRCSRRDELRAYLAGQGVGTDIHYAVPPHLQPCYSTLSHGPLPVTERMADEVLSLPIATVTERQAREIAGIINNFK